VITQPDIEESYKFARKVGRRWADKLFMTDDESNREVVKVIKLVLENGEFLDKFYPDDVLRLLERPEDDHLSASDNSSRSSDEYDDLHLESSHPSSPLDDQVSTSEPSNIRKDRDKTAQTGGHNPSLDRTRKSSSRIQKSIPHATLLHIGQLDSCNLNTTNELLQQGTAVEWKPLPALPNSTTSLVHIPNPIILPPEHIQEIHHDQLYGRPALKMPPRMDVREQISMIDQLATDRGHEGGRKQTMWLCDWSVIQRQAEKNKERLHPTKVKKEEEEEDDMEDILEVIPKCLLENNQLIHHENEDEREEEEVAEKSREETGISSVTTDTITPVGTDSLQVNNTSAEEKIEEVTSGMNNDGLLMIVETRDGERAVRRISSHDIFSKTWAGRKRKRKRQEVARNGTALPVGANDSAPSGNSCIAREPSSCGHIEWTIQEVKQKIGQGEMDLLDNVMIHRDDESTVLSHTCQGYLKTVGNIHLFEQCRVGQWIGYMDDIPVDNDEHPDVNVDKNILKKRKTAHRKAKRQRLYPNYEVGTKGYQESKLQSKILRVNEGKEGMRPRQYIDVDEQENQCMELDLGECILSVIVPSGNENDVPAKRMMAFRSLEVSLSEL
jgi:hypothetical protein